MSALSSLFPKLFAMADRRQADVVAKDWRRKAWAPLHEDHLQHNFVQPKCPFCVERSQSEQTAPSGQSA